MRLVPTVGVVLAGMVTVLFTVDEVDEDDEVELSFSRLMSWIWSSRSKQDFPLP